jgi:hypothetical protein
LGGKKKREQKNDERTPIDKWAMFWFVVTVSKWWKMVGWTEKRDGFNTYGEKFLDE